MTDKITPRQLDALVACYFGKRAISIPNPRFEGREIWWTTRTNMGGAAQRMAESLRERGLITDYNRHEDFGDKSSNDLTAKGFDALMTNHGKLPPYLQALIDSRELLQRKAEREDREAEIVRLRAEAREEARRVATDHAAQARQRRLAELRKVLGGHTPLSNWIRWSDDRLLAFADKVSSC